MFIIYTIFTIAVLKYPLFWTTYPPFQRNWPDNFILARNNRKATTLFKFSICFFFGFNYRIPKLAISLPIILTKNKTSLTFFLALAYIIVINLWKHYIPLHEHFYPYNNLSCCFLKMTPLLIKWSHPKMIY